MTIEYQILSDTSNGPTTRSVWALLKNNNEVRKAEIVVRIEADAAKSVESQLVGLWDQGEAVPDGGRAWLAQTQQAADAFFNHLIFSLLLQGRAGADLPTMLAAANMVMDDNAEQKAIFQSLNQALQTATDGQFRQFVALALTILYGKLGR